MEIKIKSINLLNFKGITSHYIGFDDETIISGKNGSGKTSVLDAFLWVLFDKDSHGNSKFEIRPLDKDGNKIHGIDITVVLTLEVNGKDITIRKNQRENWVKKRGSDHPVLQGNVNEWEIDGFPKSAAKFKEFIGELIDEDLFKLLTSPTFFTSLPWKQQRDILMSFVATVSDFEMAKGFGGYELLMDDLLKASTLDDIRKKYSKAKNEYNKKLTEIPARIDELSNSKSTDDIVDLQNNLNTVLAEKTVNQDRMVILQKKISGRQKTMDEILNLKFEKSEILDNGRAAQNKIKDDIFLTERQISNHKTEIERLQNDIEALERDNKLMTDMNTERLGQINKIESETFPKSSEFCPTCGQRLPEDKMFEAEECFDLAKQLEIDSLERGTKVANESILANDRLIGKSKRLIEDAEREISALSDTLSALQEKLDGFTTDTSEVDSKIKTLEDSLQDVSHVQHDMDSIRSYLSMVDDKEKELRERIAKADNSKIEKRIEELQAEQIQTAQKVADCEQKLYLLDRYIQQKLDAISDTINCSFDGVTFKLFETQINGGIKETCQVSVDGVPFGSLNSGHRIIAGIEIIKALQRAYGVYAPVWIDNAESISDGNIPDMDCQVIELRVSNGELEVK